MVTILEDGLETLAAQQAADQHSDRAEDTAD